MLHPVLVVTVGVILASVGTTGLLSGSGGSSSLGTININQVSLGVTESHKTHVSTHVVTYAQVKRFRSSRVSTRSEFQIMLRSLMPTSLNMGSIAFILRTPSSKLS